MIGNSRGSPIYSKIPILFPQVNYDRDGKGMRAYAKY